MILVTGGAGFIGSNLIAGLNERGVGEIAVGDFSGGAGWRNLQKRRTAEHVEPDALDRWLAGRKLDAVLHMGAISSTAVTDAELVMRVNYELPMRLLDWCASSATPFLYASSAATYGGAPSPLSDEDSPEALARLKPLNLYGRSKARFDLAVAERARRGGTMPPQWVGLKYFNVFGPNEYHKETMRSVFCQAYEASRRGAPMRLFRSNRAGMADGEQRRDFIYVKDVVAVTLWFLDHPEASGIYNVGTGRARSFNELMESLSAALGRQVAVEFIDFPAALEGRYQDHTEARMDRLREAGFGAPFTPLEEAAKDYVAYLGSPDPYR